MNVNQPNQNQQFNPNWNGPVFGQTYNTNMGPVPTMNQPGSIQQNQMPSLGAPMQQTQPVLPCKLISRVEDIKPNDVPMDGSIAVFLMNDLSSVIARQLNSRMDVDEVRFVREEVPQPVNPNDILGAIMQRLDNIEKAVKKSNNYKPRYNKNYQKGDNKDAV